MLSFFKYQGTGNDFVIVDNRSNACPELSLTEIAKICDRRFGIGADGFMLLQEKEGYDFEMIYYNADGNLGTMCGNGARCMIRFAHDLGIRKAQYRFAAADGAHLGEIEGNGKIRLKMSDVQGVENHAGHAVLNTGSPHYIKFSADVPAIDVVAKGREIRRSKRFSETGINVNFVETIGTDTIRVRTYERGVEDETLSCGTGVTAAALVSAHNDRGFNHVRIHTPGGWLAVEFDKVADDRFENIWLSGPAEFVFQGIFKITRPDDPKL